MTSAFEFDDWKIMLHCTNNQRVDGSAPMRILQFERLTIGKCLQKVQTSGEIMATTRQ
jgi:hypothetical protein